jgi:hypothetical protein
MAIKVRAGGRTLIDYLKVGGVRLAPADITKLAAMTAAAADVNLLAGMNAAGQRVKKVARVALAALDTGGGVIAWQNPEATAIVINRVTVDATTKSTGASTVDFGTTATNATTSSDNLMDGLDLGTAAGTFDNIQNAGTNGKPLQKLAAGKWVTGSRASGAAAGLVGFCYIEYVLI